MAISIKDIQEIEFPSVAMGYDPDQVDDFLDEIANQLGALVRENLAMKKQLQDMKAAPSSNIDEENYFKNLQSAMRETLISAQRVADETTTNAKNAAIEVVTKAKQEADKIKEEAISARDAAKKETDELKSSAEAYRASFIKLVQEQLQTLKSSEILFK